MLILDSQREQAARIDKSKLFLKARHGAPAQGPLDREEMQLTDATEIMILALESIALLKIVSLVASSTVMNL